MLNLKDNRLIYILNQAEKLNKKKKLAIYIQILQSHFQTKDFNKLSKDQIKEILKILALYCFKLPKEKFYLDSRKYEFLQPSNNSYCSWEYEFGWIYNYCTLKITDSRIKDDMMETIMISNYTEEVKEYFLKIQNWYVEFSVRDPNTFGNKIRGTFETIISTIFKN